ncbi:MAG: hypothetical protein CMH91_14590 [Oceanicaulis sp.]|uniref:hypothetical protein n=1 Tax=unclassified Oceanicaulis TaxID=2632123 RepID=UPI000C50843D|nr:MULTISPECIES: hypothetical protein [unclassified Oceanicaulis]MAB69594.1 hypothetical protein [Oceanicaulis sp.]MBC40274.1 hypothetical protein [Oceanicaulis sp.]MBG36769.1 hypothetical protein [Oceanicaulis sp.]HBU62442.1 hypothetical protein [Oceanicaulis sp.]HCR93311.1 hypothetical protein [Oceanicaulis sp.]|tara:strand:- start:584 stop:1039 length:456 start_codon:yes stop_codon:yes gene_type:complete
MTDAIETGAERPKTPIWFWIVAVLALIWNGFGAMDYTLTQMGNEAYLAAFTEEQLAFYLGFPLWYEAVWAIAVWSAVLGSVALLIRTKYAAPLFLVSIATYIISAAYLYGLTSAYELMNGMGGVIFSVVIFLSLVAFWRVAAWGVKAGLLR